MVLLIAAGMHTHRDDDLGIENPVQIDILCGSTL
jgi:hypothetical protein